MTLRSNQTRIRPTRQALYNTQSSILSVHFIGYLLVLEPKIDFKIANLIKVLTLRQPEQATSVMCDLIFLHRLVRALLCEKF